MRSGRLLRPSTRIALASSAFIVIYALALLVRGPFNGHQLFPFHRWELFSKVPPAVHGNFSIRLIEVDGQKLDPPLYFDEAQGYVNEPKSPVASQLMNDLGWGIRADDSDRIIRAQLQLQSRYMQNIGSARYEIVWRTFDILERRTCDCFISEEVVGTREMAPGP